jgi:hypothetical protein
MCIENIRRSADVSCCDEPCLGLSLETLLTLKVEIFSNSLSTYTETNRTHSRITSSSVLENVNKK